MRHQTTPTIDDNLFAEAAKVVAIEDKNRLAEMASTELIQNHQAAKKRGIRERVCKIAIDYDYKKLRIGE